MSEQHLSPAALEDYVLGTLDVESASMVEAHVSSCGACAKRLMREAEVEVAFAQVAERSVVRTERRAATARRSSVALGALAMAAAVLLLLVPRTHADEPSALGAPAASFDRPTIIEADASTASAQLEAVGDAAMRVGRD